VVFLDTYEHTIDEKKRLQIPSDMREKIQAEVNAGAVVESDKPIFLIAMPGDKQNIRLYTEQQWDKIARDLNDSEMDPEELLEYESVVYGLASRVELDKQGRIRVPAKLKDMVKLGNDVVLVGMKDHIDIRDRNAWNEFVEKKIKDRPEILRDPRLAIRARAKLPAGPT
jgi:MraZ protein